MKVRFLKLSNERHRLEVTRADGSQAARDCETRSFLRHDLMHFALEETAGLKRGFWGHMAAGEALPSTDDEEVMSIERAVAVLQTVAKGEDVASALPEWVTPACREAALARFRQLLGHWLATPFGQAMELTWSVKR